MHLYALILLFPYFITIFFIFIKLRKLKPYQPGKPPDVFVSVIVACRNEEKKLMHLLSSLALQDYPPHLYEVIIVDDNSDDGTRNVVLSFQGIKNLKVIPNSNSGKKMAIRTGINIASGELILTTDADCMAGQKWISTICSFYNETRPEMIIGPVSLEPMQGFFGRFQELEFISLQGVTAGSAEAGHPTICNGANLAFTRAGYLESTGNLRFDIPTGDDVFLLHDMKKRGALIKWIESRDALILTEPAPEIKAFYKQRKRWASKGTAYEDFDSIILGIVTFVTILLQVILLIASFHDSRYILIFLLSFILKSIPDFLVLHNTTKRYHRTELMKWFPAAQLAYPVYVLLIVISLAIPSMKHQNRQEMTPGRT